MVSERKGGHRTGHQASGRRSPTADSFGGGIPPESNGPPAYVVCTCGDSQVEKPARVLLWPIPANHLKGRDVRQRRRTGHKVVGVGRVYQALLVLVTATPLPCPRPSFTGHDGGLLVSMRVRQHPVTHADADSTGAMCGCPHLPGRLPRKQGGFRRVRVVAATGPAPRIPLSAARP